MLALRVSGGRGGDGGSGVGDGVAEGGGGVRKGIT